MSQLPITRMTLYKHGVAFFERRAKFNGEEIEVAFQNEEMNDVLKSLTVIDIGGGQVLGVEYATPQTKEKLLEGCSIHLGNDRSVRDLLVSLRGRKVRLLTGSKKSLIGKLLGLDEPVGQPLGTAIISVLLDKSERVQVVELASVQGVEILDDQGASDLRFFLGAALTKQKYRRLIIRLTPKKHDLSVSYIAPAPTWRVSYRMVLDTKADKALLLGWGIFDNHLEEDLNDISLSLVAGKPISFIYDLYTPFTPSRPVLKEGPRLGVDLVMEQESPLGDRVSFHAEGRTLAEAETMRKTVPRVIGQEYGLSLDDLENVQRIVAQGEELGDLFEYKIQTPVTVGRGQSAMVPIVSARCIYRKDYLYNSSKMPKNPVGTLRLKNETALTLERGPVTVLAAGEYLGEAILPFTVAGGEIAVPYSVELGVKITEASDIKYEIHQLHIKGSYFHFEDWEICSREYRVCNKTTRPSKVLIEHPITRNHELFKTPSPVEHTDSVYRFEVVAEPQSEFKLKVSERGLRARREGLQEQSHQGLQRYLEQGLIEPRVHEQVFKLLELIDKAEKYKKQLEEYEKERQKIYKSQRRIQENITVLGQTTKEGELRMGYIEDLEGTEKELQSIKKREEEVKAILEKAKTEIDSFLKDLENPKSDGA